MDAMVTNRMSTAEAYAAVRQVDDAFGPVWSELVGKSETEGNFGRLAIGTSIAHPASTRPSKRATGSYHKPSDTYFVSAALDYAAWISTDWQDRVVGYAETVKAAIGAIAKTKIDDKNRSALLVLTEATKQRVLRDVPAIVVPLGSVWLVPNSDAAVPHICFQKIDGMSHDGYIKVPPHDAFKVAVSLPVHEAPPPSIPRMYRRDADGLRFYEAFMHDGQIAEHEGMCGIGGDNRFHQAGTPGQVQLVMANLKKAAKLVGYKTLPVSKHKKLIVEYRVADSFANPSELESRHALEDYLQDLLGQLGLGWCDGGSSGSGTMEVCCFVADFELARTSLERSLAQGPFKDFSRIYRES